LGNVPWAYLVLTMPEVVRDRVTAAGELAAVRRMAVELVREWLVRWAYRGEDVQLGGLAVYHPEGDQSPGVWSPHLNIVVPLRALTSSGRYRVGRWLLPEAAIADLHGLWSEALRPWGWLGTAVCHYSARTKPEHRRHNARYVMRHFVGWQAKVSRPVYWGILRRGTVFVGVERLEPYFTGPAQANWCGRCGGRFLTVGLADGEPETATRDGPRKEMHDVGAKNSDDPWDGSGYG